MWKPLAIYFGVRLCIFFLWELCKGTSNVRTFGVVAKIGTGGLQIEQCDATASPNPELPSETLDSDDEPN